MAGARVDMPLNGAADWSSFVDIVQLMMEGFMSVSLTNMGNDSAPAVESVSFVVIKGTAYKFASDESPTGWAGLSAGNAYLYAVPSGASVTLEWSNTAPTWDSDYQGYYNGNNRCIGGAYKDASANYKHKYLYTPDIVQQTIRAGSVRPILTKVIDLGDWNMDSTGSITVTHGLEPSKLRSAQVTIRDDAGTTFVLFGTNFDHTNFTTMGIHYIRVTSGAPTVVSVERVPNGVFDNTSHDSTSYNRGWLTLEYEA